MNKTEFQKRNIKKINAMSRDVHIKNLTRQWFLKSFNYEYSYHFNWLGRPIIQYPADVVAIQEIIWKVKPDLIIETGVARGGSLIFSASILELIGNGEVLGIDIKIRKENRIGIEKHPLSKRIHMLQGSSISKNVIKKVNQFVSNKKRVLVILDSNHSHNHVLKELKFYSSFVRKGSYLIVMDTIIEDMLEKFSKNKPWGKGNNPKTAINEFLKNNSRFRIDSGIEKKLLITVAPGGYLKCTKNGKKK